MKAKFLLIFSLLLLCTIAIAEQPIKVAADDVGTTVSVPFYKEVIRLPGEVQDTDENPFVSMDSLGQATTAIADTRLIFGKTLSQNGAFLKSNYSGSLSGLLKMHDTRTQNLVNYKLAKIIEEAGLMQSGPLSTTATTSAQRVADLLDTLSRNADDVLVRTRAGELLTRVRTLGAASPSSINTVFRAENILSASTSPLNSLSPLRYATNQHNFLSAGMRTHINKLSQLGYDVIVNDVHGLKVTNRVTGEILELPALKGVSVLDDVTKVKLGKAITRVTKSTQALAKASAAVDALRAQRITALKKAFDKYNSASGITKWWYQRGLEDAVKGAKAAGLKVDFANGLLKGSAYGQTRIITNVADIDAAVRPTGAVVSRAGVIARVGQKISASAAAGSKIAKVAVVGGKVVTTAKKVVVLAGIPLAVLKGAVWAYCGFNDSDFVQPSQRMITVGANGEIAPKERGKGAFRTNSDLKYSVESNKEDNIYRVKYCLKEAYDTEGKNGLIKVFVGVTEFFNPATLAEDLVNWIESEDPPVQKCAWKVYSDSTNLNSIKLDDQFSCLPDSGDQLIDLSGFPDGKYVFGLFVQYDPVMYELLKKKENSKEVVQTNASAIYSDFGISCPDNLECNSKYGVLAGNVATILSGRVGGPSSASTGHVVFEVPETFINELEKINFDSTGDKWNMAKLVVEDNAVWEVVDSSNVVVASSKKKIGSTEVPDSNKLFFKQQGNDWFLVVNNITALADKENKYTLKVTYPKKNANKQITLTVTAKDSDVKVSPQVCTQLMTIDKAKKVCIPLSVVAGVAGGTGAAAGAGTGSGPIVLSGAPLSSSASAGTITAAQAELMELEEQLLDLETERDKIAAERDSAVQKVVEFGKRVEEQQRAIANLQAMINKLNAAGAAATARAGEAEDRTKEVQRQLDQAKKDLEDIKKKQEASKSELKQRITSLESDLANGKKNLDALQRGSDAARKEYSDYAKVIEAENQRLEKALNAAKEDADELRKVDEARQNQAKAIENGIAEAENKLTKMVLENGSCDPTPDEKSDKELVPGDLYSCVNFIKEQKKAPSSPTDSVNDLVEVLAAYDEGMVLQVYLPSGNVINFAHLGMNYWMTVDPNLAYVDVVDPSIIANYKGPLFEPIYGTIKKQVLPGTLVVSGSSDSTQTMMATYDVANMNCKECVAVGKGLFDGETYWLGKNDDYWRGWGELPQLNTGKLN